MPELPEIITIKNDLKKEILNKKIVDLEIYNNYPTLPSKREFEKAIIGHRVVNISNIAKLLTIKLSSQKYITLHLAMTGLILYNKKDSYTKIVFKFSDNSILSYSTVRKFGYIKIQSQSQLDTYKKGVGKTPLDNDFSKKDFITILKNKKGVIKNVLLDQKIVGGVGNIYANDALYMSGIHPKTKTNKIPKNKMGDLYENLNKVLKEGIKHRGSSIDRYKDIYGNKGSQQNHFKVYGKTNKLCTVCDTKITQIKISGRSTFLCEKCQPETLQKKLL